MLKSYVRTFLQGALRAVALNPLAVEREPGDSQPERARLNSTLISGHRRRARA